MDGVAGSVLLGPFTAGVSTAPGVGTRTAGSGGGIEQVEGDRVVPVRGDGATADLQPGLEVQGVRRRGGVGLRGRRGHKEGGGDRQGQANRN